MVGEDYGDFFEFIKNRFGFHKMILIYRNEIPSPPDNSKIDFPWDMCASIYNTQYMWMTQNEYRRNSILKI